MRVVLLLLILACETPKGEETGDSGETGDTGEEPAGGMDCAELGVDATWSSSGLEMQISEQGRGYALGMAEDIPSTLDPWTGEDCLRGYVTEEGVTILLCHDFDNTGLLSLETVDEREDLAGGGKTLFSEDDAYTITYAVFHEDSGTCCTWGSDPQYYSSAGCEVADVGGDTGDTGGD